jgi:hypothetical protein
MRRFFVSLVLLTNFAHLAFGQECDKAKLRGLIGYPKRSMEFKCQVGQDRDDSGDLIDTTKCIADELRRLRGGVEDAEVYLKLADLYAGTKDTAKEATARARGIELLKPHLNTRDPKKYKLLVWYCDLIIKQTPVPYEEWIQCAQRAAAIAPSQFDTWTLLGRTHEIRFLSLILGKELSELRDNYTFEMEYERFQDGLVRPSTIDKAETCLNEARRCYLRAKALAPDEPECRLELLVFINDESKWRTAFGQARGKPIEWIFPTPEQLEEARALARLRPSNLSRQCEGFALEVIHCTKAALQKFNRDYKDLSAAEKRELHNLFECTKPYRDRMEKIAQNAVTAEGKIFCLNMLLATSVMSESPTGMEDTARRILKLDPKSDAAVAVLSKIMLDSKRLNLAEDLTREQWKKYPTAKAAHIHAYCLAENSHAAEAEAVLRKGVQQWPDDFHCVLGLAAAIMKKADNAGTLEEAGKLIERARGLIPSSNEGQANLVKECDYYCAIHAALSGDAALAHLKLQRLQYENPSDERFTKALSAFKR